MLFRVIYKHHDMIPKQIIVVAYTIFYTCLSIVVLNLIAKLLLLFLPAST